MSVVWVRAAAWQRLVRLAGGRQTRRRDVAGENSGKWGLGALCWGHRIDRRWVRGALPVVCDLQLSERGSAPGSVLQVGVVCRAAALVCTRARGVMCVSWSRLAQRRLDSKRQVSTQRCAWGGGAPLPDCWEGGSCRPGKRCGFRTNPLAPCMYLNPLGCYMGWHPSQENCSNWLRQKKKKEHTWR